MKCARCAHQWFLVPEGEASEPGERDNTDYERDAASEHGDPSDSEPVFASQAQNSEEAQDSQDHDLGQDPEPNPLHDWQPRRDRDRLASAISTPIDPESGDYATSENGGAGMSAHRSGERWKGDGEEDWPDTHEEENWPDVDEIGANRQRAPDYDAAEQPLPKVGFNRFGDDNDVSPKREPEESDSQTSPDSSGWASRFMSWRAKADPTLTDEEPTSGEANADAESTIRHALRAALENPKEVAHGEGDREDLAEDGPAHSETEPELSRFFREDETQHVAASRTGDAADDTFGAAESLSRFSFADFRAETASDQDEENEIEDADPPFRLTGKYANSAIYNSGGDGAEAGAVQQHYDTHSDRGVSREDIENSFQSRSSDLDDDIAELQAELSTGDLMRYERKNRYGGLALVATWAVFISIISGVMLALVSFRQEIMTAFPGTSELYEMLGFEVAGTGVDFADVRYRWATADGKPMIEVTGQVVNVTDRAVKVPRVLVNVRDAGSADAVSATASVPTEELAPRESASFTLEFVSPPENVSQIELEFDRLR